ncbi:hypothetical protein PENTCL1PPCAC_9363, partial [Pristionchus entomophagus]
RGLSNAPTPLPPPNPPCLDRPGSGAVCGRQEDAWVEQRRRSVQWFLAQVRRSFSKRRPVENGHRRRRRGSECSCHCGQQIRSHLDPRTRIEDGDEGVCGTARGRLQGAQCRGPQHGEGRTRQGAGLQGEGWIEREGFVEGSRQVAEPLSSGPRCLPYSNTPPPP